MKDSKDGKKKKCMMPVIIDVPSICTDIASTSADTASPSCATSYTVRAKPALDTLRKPLTTSSSKVQECSCVSVAFCAYCLALQ